MNKTMTAAHLLPQMTVLTKACASSTSICQNHNGKIEIKAQEQDHKCPPSLHDLSHCSHNSNSAMDTHTHTQVKHVQESLREQHI